MGANSFNELELDALGEVINISLGASATALSTMLNTAVSITTPVVNVSTRDEFEFKRLEPAIGVEVDYLEGLEGKNIMMFRKEDVVIIVNTMMGMDDGDAPAEMDELYVSAICEVMNQMMGAAATVLSEFLGTVVNISTPKPFDVGEPEEFKENYFTEPKGMVVVRFKLDIEGKLSSEFMNLMPTKLAKRLLGHFADSFEDEEATAQIQAPAGEGEAAPAPAPAPEAAPAPAPEASPAPAAAPAPAPSPSGGGGNLSQEEMDALMASMQAGAQAEAPVAGQQPGAGPIPQPAPAANGQQPYYPYPPMPAMDPIVLQLLNQMQQTQMQMIEMMKSPKPEPAPAPTPSEGSLIRPLGSSQIFDMSDDSEEDKANQEMLMKVPLEVSVEIGRTKRLVKDILEFTQGTLVVLDKMAGEQVDLFVNGQCIARGDIVVVEDNFGIRITEIVSKEINPESL